MPSVQSRGRTQLSLGILGDLRHFSLCVPSKSLFGPVSLQFKPNMHQVTLGTTNAFQSINSSLLFCQKSRSCSKLIYTPRWTLDAFWA